MPRYSYPAAFRGGELLCGIDGLIVAGFAGFGGHRLHSTPSLNYLRSFGIGWHWWAALFAVYGVCLIVSRGWSSVAGWGLGFVLYGTCTVAVTRVAFNSPTVNPFAIGALAGFTFLHLTAMLRRISEVAPQAVKSE